MKSRILLPLALSVITALIVFAFLRINPTPPNATHKTCCKTKCNRENSDSLDNVFYNPLKRLIVAAHS